jgi:transcription initiation factor IIE alpha subunit
VADELASSQDSPSKRAFDRYARLRESRLFSYLREREPDDQVGYSILIYRLTDQEVQAALHGPLEELEEP